MLQMAFVTFPIMFLSGGPEIVNFVTLSTLKRSMVKDALAAGILSTHDCVLSGGAGAARVAADVTCKMANKQGGITPKSLTIHQKQ